MTAGLILSLPPEPAVGTVVVVVDGDRAGRRYQRLHEDSWHDVTFRETSSGFSWSELWWRVTEDGSGATSVRVIPPDPFPLPWRVAGEKDTYVEAANGRVVCEIEQFGSIAVEGHETRRTLAERIVHAVNAAGDTR